MTRVGPSAVPASRSPLPSLAPGPGARTLALLGGGVLLAHLWGLAGAPLWSFSSRNSPNAQDALPARSDQANTTTTPAAGTPTTVPTLAPLPVERSTVRWIVLPEPRPEPPPAPAPAPRKAPPQPPPAPAVVEAPATIPEPEPLPEPAVADVPAPPPPPAVAEAPAPTPSPEPQTAPPAPVATPSPTASLRADSAPDAHNLLPSAGNLANQLAGSTELRYTVSGQSKGFQYHAGSVLAWQHDGGSYTARTEISAFLVGSRQQESTGRIGPAGLEPERFADRRRSETAAHFDRTAGRIRYSRNTPDAPLLPGAQDRVSVILQLGLLLNARPDALGTGQIVRLPVTDTTSSEVWQFEVGPEEDLALPAGTVRARKLLRSPRKEFDQRVEIWLAPSLRHLPVRIRLTSRNGDVADQQLTELPPIAVQPEPPAQR